MTEESNTPDSTDGTNPERSIMMENTRHTGPSGQGFDRRTTGSFVNESGETIEYETCVRLVDVPCSDEDLHPVGTMSLTSFVRLVDGKTDAGRPVLAMFNGGPIVASTALLLSGIGPVRASFNDDLNRGAHGPYELEDSPSSVLTNCDIVIMDAIGCGYGRYADGVEAKSKYSCREDARQFAEALASWLVAEGRDTSPIYVLGESYGTVRAPLMAKAMLEAATAQIAVHGVILMGTTTNIQEVHDRRRSVMGPVSSLPLMAAVAWYHGKGSKDAADWRDAIDEARAYAYGPYLTAVCQGSRLPLQRRHEVAEDLERITGIKAPRWERSRLSISKDAFRSLLLEDEGKVLGVYDARYTAPAIPGEDVDPSDLRISTILSACSRKFYCDLLGVPREMTRVESPGDAWSSWDWSYGGPSDGVPDGSGKSPFDEFDYAGALEYCLRQIDGCRLMVVNGCYDTITTVGASDALISSMDVTAGQVVQRIYPAGHMTYSDRASCVALNHDLSAFVTGDGRDE